MSQIYCPPSFLATGVSGYEWLRCRGQPRGSAARAFERLLLSSKAALEQLVHYLLWVGWSWSTHDRYINKYLGVCMLAVFIYVCDVTHLCIFYF